jgi:hypothetical protein
MVGQLAVRAFAKRGARNAAQMRDIHRLLIESLADRSGRGAYLGNSTTAVLSIAAKDLLFAANQRWDYSAGKPSDSDNWARAALGTNPVQR